MRLQNLLMPSTWPSKRVIARLLLARAHQRLFQAGVPQVATPTAHASFGETAEGHDCVNRDNCYRHCSV